MRLLFLFTIFFSVNSAASSFAKKPYIVTSINPIYQIAQAISMNHAQVKLIINPNQSQHHHSFRQSDIQVLHEADLIFYVSRDLEKKFPQFIKSNHKEKQSFELIKIDNLKVLQQQYNPQKRDVHIWLNPQNAVVIAQFIARHLAEIDPQNAKIYHHNLQKFKEDIAYISQKIHEQLAAISKSNGYILYHDGYHYFENYFGLQSQAILQYDDEAEITFSAIKKVDDLVKKGAVKCMLGQTHDHKNTAIKIAKNYGLNYQNLDIVGQMNKSYLQLLEKLSEKMTECIQ